MVDFKPSVFFLEWRWFDLHLSKMVFVFERQICLNCMCLWILYLVKWCIASKELIFLCRYYLYVITVVGHILFMGYAMLIMFHIGFELFFKLKIILIWWYLTINNSKHGYAKILVILIRLEMVMFLSIMIWVQSICVQPNLSLISICDWKKLLKLTIFDRILL